MTPASADDEVTLLQPVADALQGGVAAAEVLPAGDAAPAQLVVDLDVGPDVVARVHVCFVPGWREPRVLQYFALTGLDVAPERLAETARVVNAVNATMPMNGFELGEAPLTIAFRHLQSVADGALDGQVVAWPLWMVQHAFSTFGPLLVAISDGAATDEVLAALAEVVAGLGA